MASDMIFLTLNILQTEGIIVERRWLNEIEIGYSYVTDVDQNGEDFGLCICKIRYVEKLQILKLLLVDFL